MFLSSSASQIVILGYFFGEDISLHVRPHNGFSGGIWGSLQLSEEKATMHHKKVILPRVGERTLPKMLWRRCVLWRQVFTL